MTALDPYLAGRDVTRHDIEFIVVLYCLRPDVGASAISIPRARLPRSSSPLGLSSLARRVCLLTHGGGPQTLGRTFSPAPSALAPPLPSSCLRKALQLFPILRAALTPFLGERPSWMMEAEQQRSPDDLWSDEVIQLLDL